MERWDPLVRAQECYERAVFGGDPAAVAAGERELDGLDAASALARGRLVHARFLVERQEDAEELALFERAEMLFERVGDRRGLGEALFWKGIVHQVVRGDHEAATPLFEQAHELATETGDRLTTSYALRHLGIAAHVAGDLAAARARLEESTALRRELGFGAGVAANLIGLAYIAGVEQRPKAAAELLDEADDLARRSDAAAIAAMASEARGNLGL
ncbi:hypothetical protein Sru01_50680 [Sphaerisporangium rufum]|uniref:Tetratricopeptide repeat protein n=1 Tax=Sphaerisporangium rufum TaxID=1381558 RepID=A0A919R7Z4_9ACTN|nr:tetratricopeptide repeat protein [Sphaerisporangium rufum]GII80086.1 hypothetical protein Sru01_50680 [Sphaerisporangium rufum]